MRKLILKMSVTIDGFVGGPNGELDWIFKTLGEDATAWTVDQLWQAGAHLMGRRTFHDMAAYWPSSTEAFAAPMNDIPKIVFSRKGFTPSQRGDVTVGFDDAVRLRRADGSNTASTLPPSAKTWAEAIVASGDMTQEVMKLKKQSGKDLIAHGGAGFAQSLAQTGLIDEFWFLTHPVALGHGLPLFSLLPNPLYLKLVSVTAFRSGAVAHVYQRSAAG